MAGDGRDQVDGLGGEAAHEDLAGGRLHLTQVAQQVLGRLGLAVAVPAGAQQRGAVGLGDRDDVEHAGDGPDLLGVRRDVGRVGALQQQLGGRHLPAAELLVEDHGRLVGRRVLGEHAVVHAAPLRAEERAGDREQRGDRDDHDQHRAAHHRVGQGRPTAAVGGGQGTVAAPGQAAGVNAASQQAQHGRQDRQRSQHRDDHGGDTAVPHRAEEGLREDQQAGHRSGHGQAGEEHGAAGGGHGPADRDGGGVGLVERLQRQLLTEAADDEERVVDGQADAQQRDHVDREDRDLGELRDHPDHREGAEHRDDTDHGRHQGGDRGAEDQQREQDDDRQRDELGALEVVGGDLVDVVVDGVRPGDRGLQAAGLRRVEHGRDAVVADQEVVLGLAGQRDQHLGVAAVVAHQPRLGRGLVVGHHRSDRVRGDVGHDLLDGCPERRVVGGEIAVLGRVDRDDVDALVAEGLALGVELACGLRRRVVEPALGQRVEDTGAEGTGPQGEQHPDEQDGEGPAAHECSPTIDHDGSSRSA